MPLARTISLASHAQKNLLRNVIDEYEKIKHQLTQRVFWMDMTEGDLWSELCVCILSSNVPFESATSAFEHLRRKGLLEKEYLLGNEGATSILSKELSKPLYLPHRRDGNLRKYRFPRIKASHIVGAAQAIYIEGDSIKSLLSKSGSAYEARDFLTRRVPGIGLKQSSLFLRNIGYTRSLAIIDTHILNFLRTLELSQKMKTTRSLSKERYKKLEKMLQALAGQLDAELSILDFAIWIVMRKGNWRPQ